MSVNNKYRICLFYVELIMLHKMIGRIFILLVNAKKFQILIIELNYCIFLSIDSIFWYSLFCKSFLENVFFKVILLYDIQRDL